MNDFDKYQEKAVGTAIYPNRGSFAGLCYCTLKLNGEAGEIAEKIGKTIRDDKSLLSQAKMDDLAKELGDVLWYIAASAAELGFQLSEIADRNITKLLDRKARGTLGGSGDNR